MIGEIETLSDFELASFEDSSSSSLLPSSPPLTSVVPLHEEEGVGVVALLLSLWNWIRDERSSFNFSSGVSFTMKSSHE